jgi:hypothetical protein
MHISVRILQRLNAQAYYIGCGDISRPQGPMSWMSIHTVIKSIALYIIFGISMVSSAAGKTSQVY